jgi:hypothetical protein
MGNMIGFLALRPTEKGVGTMMTEITAAKYVQQ